MKGFKRFLLRGNLVELAVAVVIGVAFGALITALVRDLITPLIAAIGGKPDFSQLYFTVNKSKFAYGDFINAVIAFVIIAAVIYFLVILPVGKLLERTMRNEEATERECPECLSEVPKAARRCLYCTAHSRAGDASRGWSRSGVALPRGFAHLLDGATGLLPSRHPRAGGRPV